MKSKSFIIVASLLFVASAASLVAAQNPDKSADGGNDYHLRALQLIYAHLTRGHHLPRNIIQPGSSI